MRKWQEDTMYEITMSVQREGVEREFQKQLKKMRTQPEWKYKTISERYEYAYRKVTNR